MTRFARSKGSKASNERIPENATPWQVMKDQLEEKKQDVIQRKKRKQMEETRMQNYKNFLEEKEKNIKPEWVEFENQNYEANELKKPKTQKKKAIVKNDRNLKSGFELQSLIDKIEGVLEDDEKVTCNENKTKKKKRNLPSTIVDTNIKKPKLEKGHKKSLKNVMTSFKGTRDENYREQEPEKPNNDDLRNKSIINEVDEITSSNINSNKLKKNIANEHNKHTKKNECIDSIETKNENVISNTVNEPNRQEKKRLQRNRKGKAKKENAIQNIKPKKNVEEMTEDEIKKVNKKKEKKLRQLENRKKKKAEVKEIALKEDQKCQNMKKHKLPKEKDNKEHIRRKPNTQIEKININGVDIEIDYFDGFPVKREDAERLRKLKKEMISRGIPKSEVQLSLKLERRKAEKSLAREKKKVCFNCRQSGHVLSECPNLNENSHQEVIGTGICFKCGSTEHTHFECKVVRSDNFKYATCFICREQGHISRQCPDNQRGLYPKGGACRECGDVTHLKKDCPKFQEKQESQTVKLETLEFNNIEDFPDTNTNIKKQGIKSKKIIKF